MISNPPYISPRGFDTTTARSVRNYEPRDALVPPARKGGAGEEAGGDVFYPRLLEIAARVRAKVVVFEVADMTQAGRVAGMVARDGKWEGCEVWRDWAGEGVEERGGMMGIDGREVRVVGREEGNGRAVLAWTGEGGRMLGREVQA